MGELNFYELKCQRCGGQLEAQGGNTYVCVSCGKTYEKQSPDIIDQLNNVLNRQKQEEVANLRRLLWNETHEEYVSNRKVEEICGKILAYIPEDFYANFYLATCGRKKGLLNDFLDGIDVDANYNDIPDILDYLIKALKAEWVMPVSNLIERAYKDNDLKLYNKYRTQFEAESVKIDECVFEPAYPRDVFVAYSSKDMPKVEALVSVLESEKLSCFVAARNLRHGSGSVENYESAINTAIEHCSVIVFVSSDNSRSNTCDAYKELNYVEENCKDKPRIEYLIKNYSGRAAERFFKNFFSGLEYCTSEKDVAVRVCSAIMDPAPHTSEDKSISNDGQNDRMATLKKAKILSIEGKYKDAKKLYTQLKNANPDDMDAYIGLVRIASENFRLYEGEDVEESIRIATDLFHKNLLKNSEYKQYIRARNKYLIGKRKPQKSYSGSAGANVAKIIGRGISVAGGAVVNAAKITGRGISVAGGAVVNASKIIGHGISVAGCAVAKTTKNGAVAVADKFKENYSLSTFITLETLFSILFIVMLVLAIITQNAYYIGITVGCGVFMIQLIFSFFGVKDCVIFGLDLIVAIPLVFVCIVLWVTNHITLLCTFFITIGFMLSLVFYIVFWCIDKDRDDFMPGYLIGYFIESVILLAFSIGFLGAFGFGTTKISDNQLEYYFDYSQEVVTVPDGVTSIGASAFCNTFLDMHDEIVEIILPEGITSIGANAFSGCPNLTTINIPESVTYVSTTAFEDTSVTELYLPAGVTESVAYLSYAQSYTISENNTAFYMDNGCLMRASDNCLMLVSSDGSLAENISSVASYAYITVKTAISVTFPENVSTVQEYTFYGCGASCITIGSDVAKINSKAFYGCYATEIVVQEGVTTIESGAFCGSQPEKITVPFIGCYKSSTTAYFGDIFGTEKCGDISTYKDKGKNRIPDSLTSVTVLSGEVYVRAFYKCKKITQVTLGSGVTSIAGNSFWKCKNITSLYISSGVSYIGRALFDNSITVDIFYEGSAESWNNIDKYYSSSFDTWGGNATFVMHYNYDINLLN